MRKYLIRLSGSIGVERLDINRDELDDARATQHTVRIMPLYWPVYYKAELWHLAPGKETLVGEYRSEVQAHQIKR